MNPEALSFIAEGVFQAFALIVVALVVTALLLLWISEVRR